jgi:hypothetical protein
MPPFEYPRPFLGAEQMNIPAKQSAEHHYLRQQSKSSTSAKRPPSQQCRGNRSGDDEDDGGDADDDGGANDDTGHEQLLRKRILDDYVDEEELAQEFEVTVGTLRRWRRRKIGPPWVRGPGGVIYPIAEGRQWLRDKTQT